MKKIAITTASIILFLFLYSNDWQLLWYVSPDQYGDANMWINAIKGAFFAILTVIIVTYYPTKTNVIVYAIFSTIGILIYLNTESWFEPYIKISSAVYFGIYGGFLVVSLGFIAIAEKTEKIAEAKSLQSEIAALQQKIADLQLSNETLQSEIAQQKDAIAENKTTQSEMKWLQFELENQTQKNEKLKLSNETLQSEIAQQKNEIADLQFTISNSRAVITKMIDVSLKSKNKIEKLRSEIAEKNEIAIELQNEFENLAELQPEIAEVETTEIKSHTKIADLEKLQDELSKENKIAQALQLKLQGKSNKEIAIFFGVSESTISRWLQYK
ncbi:MAG TPA: hypothetical protein DCS19_05770 [Flavobacterium sp.]|nr:hypothetical protein [Flavobacterium sp.]